MATLSANDLTAKAEELVKKITGDNSLLDKFKADPKETVKALLQDKVSDDVVTKITDIVKTKVKVDDAKDIIGSIKNLFKK